MSLTLARKIVEGAASAALYQYVGMHPLNIGILFHMIVVFIMATRSKETGHD